MADKKYAIHWPSIEGVSSLCKPGVKSATKTHHATGIFQVTCSKCARMIPAPLPCPNCAEHPAMRFVFSLGQQKDVLSRCPCRRGEWQRFQEMWA